MRWVGWPLLQSHHRQRDGPFELNDVFAIINAVPAVALLSYGFFTRGLLAGLCFGAVSLLSSFHQKKKKKVSCLLVVFIPLKG